MTVQLPLERFQHWLEVQPERVWLSQPIAGQWQNFTWLQVDEQARRMAGALLAFGCQPGDRVALLAKNCAEWIISDLAIMMAGLVSVPLYPLQSAESIGYVLEHAQCKAIFIGKLDEPEQLLSAVAPQIKRIAMPGASNVPDSYLWQTLLAEHQPLLTVAQQTPEQLLTLVYTSGTTGNPKGVMLSVLSLAYTGENGCKEMGVKADDQYFSFLPLSHVAERNIVEFSSLYSGAPIAFCESQESFVRDLQHVRPTIFFAVPRLWARFQLGVLAKMSEKKLDRLLRTPLVGALLAKKIRKGLGLDRTRLIVSGAASISRGLLDWYQRLGLTICEGYGMSENFAYGTFNRPGQIRFGTVGRPMPGLDVRIAESGEILLRSPTLMQGYYLEPEKTAETLVDGWLHTGDKGEIDADGYLRITGRIKDIFKTSKGKYIAPAPIEGELSKNSWIEQVCLIGSGLDQPVALLELAPVAHEVARQQVDADLQKTLDQLNAQLDPHERISHLLVVRDGWTVTNGCMTPTLKIRRNVLESRYTEVAAGLSRKQPLYWEE